ncbi:hypothetical protein LMG8520_2095 [Lactococcus lactis subsp. lactis]|uniref:Uncharacterized protein n=1 Tax=Lactococcus lactis subsp. lactis TaxID=1360 RepID=A0A0V8CZD1_LACLL|nr:hypothetical protein LMG8520_2095 [Lactococcus lactis subsp. lactis]
MNSKIGYSHSYIKVDFFFIEPRHEILISLSFFFDFIIYPTHGTPPLI